MSSKSMAGNKVTTGDRQESGKAAVANYLTQLKELPQESGDIADAAEPKDTPMPKHGQKGKIDNKMPIKKATEKESAKIKAELPLKPEEVNSKDEKTEEEEAPGGPAKETVVRFTLPPRDIILGIVNLLTLIILTFLLVRLPKEAQGLKTLRNESIQPNDNASLLVSDIELNSQRAERLQKLFLNDSGVVDFVKDIEGFKAGGAITKLSFANQKAVRDKTGSFGIPVIIELTGKQSDIEADIAKIQALPYLFRPVSIEAQAPVGENQEELTGQIELQYGGLLYVQDELGQN